jgi:hypothetical protein
MNSKAQSIVLLFAALSVGNAAVVTATSSCGGEILTPQETANLSYKAQLTACVDQYADRASIDRCRRRVEQAWSTDAAPEAGRTLNFANDNDAGRTQ